MMNTNNVAIAEAYYTAMKARNIEGMGQYLHPDVTFMGPLAKLMGKEAVLEAAIKFSALFESLTIREKFETSHQAMLVNDLKFPAPIGNIQTAVLMDIQEGLIRKIELFYDARPFEKKRDEIFS